MARCGRTPQQPGGPFHPDPKRIVPVKRCATSVLPRRKSLTPSGADSSLAALSTDMSENTPNPPGGSVPPKPPEAAKIQPKKETVRISLPPKPTSSPTIKLPTLPAGGPAASSAPAAAAAPAAAPGTSGGAPLVPRPPTAGSPGLSVAGAASAAPAAARPATNTGAPAPRPAGAPAASGPRPAPSGGARKISGLDMGLGIAAAVMGVGAAVSMALLLGLK